MSAARLVRTSVTVFIHCGDEYLMLLRSAEKSVDANRLNGIGGKLEPGENYLAAVVRETEEETGLVVRAEQVRFHGIGKIEGGYVEDWVMGFFSIEVSEKTVTHGLKTTDGQLLWMHKDDVLKSEFEIVDDLRFIFPRIVNGEKLFFFTAQMDEKEKVQQISIDELDLR